MLVVGVAAMMLARLGAIEMLLQAPVELGAQPPAFGPQKGPVGIRAQLRN
jgi:hypothetical protein